MKKLAIYITSVITSVMLSLAVVAPVGAVNAFDGICDGEAGGSSVVCDNKDDDVNNIVATVINTLLFVVGILSVIMLIVGGIRYTTSAGNANNVTAAKNTITYAIVGLVVSLAAFAVVNWVMSLF